MICQNGPGPLPDGDDSVDGEGGDDDDETKGDSGDEEDSDQSAGDTEDEDESGSGHATTLLKGILVLGVSIATWHVLG
jgi:hypothetical protein